MNIQRFIDANPDAVTAFSPGWHCIHPDAAEYPNFGIASGAVCLTIEEAITKFVRYAHRNKHISINDIKKMTLYLVHGTTNEAAKQADPNRRKQNGYLDGGATWKVIEL